MDLLELLKNAQGVGAPISLIAVYFLWKIDKCLTVMKNSNDVLTETLLRLVPGFKSANDQAKQENAIRDKAA